MINQTVITHLEWLWSIFDIKLLSFIAAGFTIYFGTQKLTQKISVSYHITSCRLYETRITNLILANKRDNTITFSKIYIKINEQSRGSLVDLKKPIILKAYETIDVDVPLYTTLSVRRDNVEISFTDNITFYLLTTSGKLIECETEVSGHIETEYPIITKNILTLRGVLLTNKMSYVFFYVKNGKELHCILDWAYMIHVDNPFNGNVFENFTPEILKDILIKDGYHNQFEQYILYKVNENLSCTRIFSKESVSKHSSNMTLQRGTSL
ncbi:hypothetical protein [Buttiauxella sp.]|uniref:hypothetical protein n=1 Tax=Buttiauxella sp. TaxID=1972222 RepID=UPI003C720AA9